MNIQEFIDAKSSQLTYFLRAFWNESIPYSEINLFFWDTLEEWIQVRPDDEVPYTQKERVFWHLLHQLHYWPEHKVKSDTYLRGELNTCLEYLEGGDEYPLDCVGIRP